MNRALRKCYRLCGSQVVFAALIGVSASALTKWNNNGIPPRRVPQIVRVMRVKFRAAITHHELRPDLYPIVPSVNRHTAPHDLCETAVQSARAAVSTEVVEPAEPA